MQGYSAPPTSSRLPVDETRKLQEDVNQEYHDPYDDWSIRDILVSLVPFIIVYAFRDVGLRGALAFALVWSWFLILYRVIAMDSRRKTVWPLFDILGMIAFPILLGLTYIGPGAYNALFRWMPIILPAIWGFAVALSVAWRRPFTAHYARYPKFDRGGSAVWHGDGNFRAASDYASLGWFTSFAIICLLGLIPTMTDFFTGYSALNIIFAYIIPAVLLILALANQQLMGVWYRRKASSQAQEEARTAYTAEQGTAGYPTGATEAVRTTEGAAVV